MSPDAISQPNELEPTVLDGENFYKPPGEATGPAEAGPNAAPEPEALPVSSTERHFTVDVLRGFALLGILAMNITLFGWPWPAYSNPLLTGGSWLDRAVWFFNHLFFEEKMMTIFSMLFGAGLILMDQRAEARGARIGWVYYRRVLLLLLIGLIHSYLIWVGDILVLYAQCGLLLYFFRNLRPHTLIICGVASLLVLVPILMGFAAAADSMQAAAKRVEAQKAAGQAPDPRDAELAKAWNEGLSKFIAPTPEQEKKGWDTEMKAYRGSYRGIVRYRAGTLVFLQTIVTFMFGLIFAAIGRMLIGMGLMKLGVFSGERSRAFYIGMVAIGYGIGLPLMVFDGVELFRHKFSHEYSMHGGQFLNSYGSVVVALGHIGMLILVVKSGALKWLTARLAAVGRMALSNYLTHSIVCTTLFYGYGFRLYGHVPRIGLAAIVFTIWVAQLLISPIWLKYFRFGPAEWIWRSLTYGRLQPMWAPEGAKPPAALSAGL